MIRLNSIKFNRCLASTIYIFVALFIANNTLYAQNQGNIAAREFAANFFRSKAKSKTPLKSFDAKSDLEQLYQSPKKVKTPLFIFQQKGEGFAMVAQSNNRFEIVGYSSAEIPATQIEKIPPQLRYLMNFYEDSLQLTPSPLKSTTLGTPIVPALLDQHGIKLNQYNHPEVGGSYTGCMATAFTQILLFHQAEQGKPIKGYDSHCYTHDVYGELCADFENTVYDNPEILSYHMAIAMDMNFTPEASSPKNYPDLNIYNKYFHHFVANGINEEFYIKNELNNRRPLYAGLTGLPKGHAVVIDGYDDRGYLHLNFGWGGVFNGYFLMNNYAWFGTGKGTQKFSSNPTEIYISSPSFPPVNTQDSLALVSIHNALGGYEVTKWDLTKSVWTWQGVLIMNDRVIRLSLPAETPSPSVQSISPQIGDLTALQELSIDGCLNGTIPSSIINLTSLKKLHISNTPIYIAPTLHKGDLSWALPNDIDNLINLEELSCSNVLEGTIPATIGNLTNLKLLSINQDTSYFGRGKLNGTIPLEIGNLTNLLQLNISNQSISGEIPTTVTNLTALRELTLSNNLLNGSIPSLNFPQMEYLNLSSNLFTSFSGDVWNCPLLRSIQLENNRLSKSIPATFGNSVALEILNVSNNQLETLPETMGNLTKLKTLKADNNLLKALPNGLATILNLQHLSASRNNIHYIPSNLGQSNNLGTLDLSNNQITFIPEEIGNCPNIGTIYLNSNKIETIPASFNNFTGSGIILLQDNELSGEIPAELLIDIHNQKHVRLDSNRFVFTNIPQSDKLRFGVRNQKEVKLKKRQYLVQIGDTVTIDVRTISNLAHPDNEYYWLVYPELLTNVVKDERYNSIQNSPVLKIIINETNAKNRYYCKVFNPKSPLFSFLYYDITVTSPCMEYLNTEIIEFKLASDEEIIAEKLNKERVISLESLSNTAITDGSVTLVPPLNIKRGVIQWEASKDGVSWEKVSNSMSQAELQANIETISQEQLVIKPLTTAFYRCGVVESNCNPLYSNKLKIEAFGKTLFDEIINVTENSRTISVDSIEVVVPKQFHDQDFRLTITKINNPPADPDSVLGGTAYDVKVSFADVFKIPLLIKLKNIDKSKITDKNISQYKAVYFDETNQAWKQFDRSFISLKDSSLIFETNHLTKMKWWWYAEEYRMGFTDVYERNNIMVFYKDSDRFNYENFQTNQKWHVADIPLIVQDITEYLPKIMAKYDSLGLKTPDDAFMTQGKFKVYVQDLNGPDGCVGIIGMLNGYLSIDIFVYTPTALKQVLAHEFMHYTQDFYISANVGNQFWMEAHATLSDRIVWDENEIPLCESEEFFKDGISNKNVTFNALANSWDYWDNYVFNRDDQQNYLAGCFLHYMRSYRTKSEKLDPATLLSETSWLGSWRTYLSGYTNSHLNSILGDEYEDFVKYILSAKNEKFTLINKKGNPYAYLQDPKNKGLFTLPITYEFKEGDDMAIKDIIDVKVPYLASKIVLLENNADTLVLVNYKRKHSFDYDHLVYHVTYDYKKQEMIFQNISDSTEYNFLLEPRDKENALTNFNNYSFLLLINKEYIGASSLIKDFEASFELTAMPVLNIERISMLGIYNGESPLLHNFTLQPQNLTIGTPNADYIQKATEMKVEMVNLSTSKQIINEHTYQIKTQFSLIIDEGMIMGMPTMKDSTSYIQTIEHDIITGVLKITEEEIKTHIMHTYIEFVNGAGDDVEEHLVHSRYTDFIETKTKIYWLNNFNNNAQEITNTTGYEEAYGENIKVYKTSSTAETQALVDRIDGTVKRTNYDEYGAVTSNVESNYLNTDFSNPSLNLQFIFHTIEK